MLPLKIHIPNFAKPEISYALHCLFEEFLGIAIKIEEQEHGEHITVFGSKKNLEIRNHFFKSDKVENHYSPENIPTSISKQQYGKISCICLFGEAVLVENEDTLILHNDIISATFFMLSRWEEYAIKDRDAHGRFDFTKALSVKLDFYQRPVVNEWVELLWSLLEIIQPKITRKTRAFSTKLTSDIDDLKRWKSLKDVGFWLWHNISKGNASALKQDCGSLVKRLFNKQTDPYNNLVMLSDLAASKSKAIFYLKTPLAKSSYDGNKYAITEALQGLPNTVEIGLHPGYESYNNELQLKAELQHLVQESKRDIKLLRQHYLRFEVPRTWEIQNNLKLKVDSSMLYEHEAGFRCGVCYAFPVYNILTREKLALKESPLLFMETPYLKSKDLGKLKRDFEKIELLVKAYQGDFIFLWHNENLIYNEQRSLLKSLLSAF